MGLEHYNSGLVYSFSNLIGLKGGLLWRIFQIGGLKTGEEGYSGRRRWQREGSRLPLFGDRFPLVRLRKGKGLGPIFIRPELRGWPWNLPGYLKEGNFIRIGGLNLGSLNWGLEKKRGRREGWI